MPLVELQQNDSEHGADRQPDPSAPTRRTRILGATLLSVCVLALTGAGYAVAQVPSTSASADSGPGLQSHCH